MIQKGWKAAWLVPMALVVAASAASAQTKILLNATLNGSMEAPTKVSTGAAGSAEVNVDIPRQEVTVNVQVYNLPAGTTGAHIHVGGPDTAGPIIFDFQPTPGVTGDFNVNLRFSASRLIPRAAQGILTMADAIQAMSLGNTYVNVHSTANPGGEIRGQLVVIRIE